MRTETSIESANLGDTHTIITTYDYDSNFRIEAPDLSGKKVIDEKTYKSFVVPAYEKTKKQKYRVSYKTNNDTPDADLKRTLKYEFTPSANYHRFYEYYEGDRLRQYEKIEIGDVEYEKYDKGVWKLKTEPDTLNAYSERFVVGTSYEYLGKHSVNEQSTDLYQKIRTLKFSPDSVKVNYETTRYWINESGLIVKFSFDTTDEGLSRLLDEEKDYEYDTNIKVEPPRISKTKKP